MYRKVKKTDFHFNPGISYSGLYTRGCFWFSPIGLFRWQAQENKSFYFSRGKGGSEQMLHTTYKTNLCSCAQGSQRNHSRTQSRHSHLETTELKRKIQTITSTGKELLLLASEWFICSLETLLSQTNNLP